MNPLPFLSSRERLTTLKNFLIPLVPNMFSTSFSIFFSTFTISLYSTTLLLYFQGVLASVLTMLKNGFIKVWLFLQSWRHRLEL